VADLEPLLLGSIAMVAPLRYGAGMKGKVTQSLAIGLPVVTTTIGAEGLGAVDGDGILFADEPEAIAARVVRLYREPDAWRSLSAAGLEIADRVCSPKVQRDAIQRLLGATSAAGPDLVRSLGV
jgi:glycosyltransferase involved in cell wall biosynthesis